MTSTTAAQVPVPSTPRVALETAVVRNWKAPVAFGIFSVLAFVLLIVFGRTGTTTYRLSTESDLIQLPVIPADVQAVSIGITVLMVAITAVAFWFTWRARPTPLWLVSIFAVLFVIGFLTWAAAGALIPIPGLLVGAVGLSVPLIFGALGGVISERVDHPLQRCDHGGLFKTRGAELPRFRRGLDKPLAAQRLRRRWRRNKPSLRYVGRAGLACCFRRCARWQRLICWVWRGGANHGSGAWHRARRWCGGARWCRREVPNVGRAAGRRIAGRRIAGRRADWRRTGGARKPGA